MYVHMCKKKKWKTLNLTLNSMYFKSIYIEIYKSGYKTPPLKEIDPNTVFTIFI